MTGPHGPILTGTKLMLPDDESLLSAYLDGELGREGHEAVESFLNSDPRLTETLRGLVGVRDLLADLSRPVAGDAAPEVMRRLGERRAGSRPWRSVKHPIRWVAAGVAAAAVLGFLVVSAVQRQDRRADVAARNELKADPSGRPVTGGPGQDLAASGRSTPDRVDSSVSETTHPARARAGQERGRALSVTQAPGMKDDQDKEATRVRALLDNPRLRRTFFVTDQIDQPALNHVASVVEQTTRHDYFKITIAQGIVIDPRHPDQATVFALVLDESELATLRGRLQEAFKENVREAGVDPGVAAQLTDIGQVASFAPNPIGNVIIPKDRLSAILLREDQPTPEQENSAPVAGRRRSANEVDLARQEPTVSAEAAPADNPAGPAPHPRIANVPGKIAAAAAVPPAQNPIEPASRPEAISGDAPRARQPVIVLVWVSHARSG
jgi:hypothetical protein